MSNKIIVPLRDQPIVDENGNAVLRFVKFNEEVSSQLQGLSLGVLALTDEANIATNCQDHSMFTVTLEGNRTLDNPTEKIVGKVYYWVITQDGVGSRTLAFGTDFTFIGSSTINSGIGDLTIIRGLVLDNTTVLVEL